MYFCDKKKYSMICNNLFETVFENQVDIWKRNAVNTHTETIACFVSAGYHYARYQQHFTKYAQAHNRLEQINSHAKQTGWMSPQERYESITLTSNIRRCMCESLRHWNAFVKDIKDVNQ